MTRIRGHKGEMDWVALEKLAKKRGMKIHYRVARCEHGKTSRQTCRDCEGGYVQDTSVYANLPADVLAVAVSDDGEDVAFLTTGRAR